MRKLFYVIFIVAGVYLFVTYMPLLFRAFVYDTFRIPTESMEPTLMPGDKVYVNKLILGPRMYKDLDSATSRRPELYRLKGFRDIRRNDILVFNLPVPYRWDKIEYLINFVYCKRCIGLPGDTISAVEGFYRNSGTDKPVGHIPAQEELHKMHIDDWGDAKYIYPFDSTYNWTFRDFGPFYIPGKGDAMNIDDRNVKLYKLPIEYETQKKITVRDGVVFLGDSVINRYTFTRNYYFAAGDNAPNSSDSRYWGLLPEEHVVGVVTRVLYSRKGSGKKWDWSRFMLPLK